MRLIENIGRHSEDNEVFKKIAEHIPFISTPSDKIKPTCLTEEFSGKKFRAENDQTRHT